MTEEAKEEKTDQVCALQADTKVDMQDGDAKQVDPRQEQSLQNDSKPEEIKCQELVNKEASFRHYRGDCHRTIGGNKSE